jgi:hypothetical protein
MDEILREHKKKLIVKTKNHMYLSINDVFEQREEEQIEDILKSVNQYPDRKKNSKNGLIKKKTFEETKDFKAFQKKVKTKQKKFHEDLMA